MTTLQDLKKLRARAMHAAAVAWALGFLFQIGVFAFGSASTGSWMHAAATVSATFSLMAIAVVLAAVFLVWIPSHDQIVYSLRLKWNEFAISSAQADFGFQSTEDGASPPPPRAHLR